MYEFEEVYQWMVDNLDVNDINDNKRAIKSYYDLISNPQNRVNDEDKKWVACSDDDERETVKNAIKEFINKDDETIENAIEETCILFNDKKVTHKHRIPFYIVTMFNC